MHVTRAVKIESQNGSEKLRALLAHHGQPFPHRLAAGFPHVVKRILSVWQTPDKARTYFKLLLTKEQDGSQGFPFDVYQEIFVLGAFYDKQHPALRDRGDIWAGFSI
ncbi:MAG: hypothetical protein A3I66_10420 [Burkholderiales bacterium RIFCSPLOWO2_02_FULL_57_36]|nr:MAG: hypothetical protein A3I66_10420 [Burkholderiales bacterium RIFCSPLOWO2_02_FULL_57_36]